MAGPSMADGIFRGSMVGENSGSRPLLISWGGFALRVSHAPMNPGWGPDIYFMAKLRPGPPRFEAVKAVMKHRAIESRPFTPLMRQEGWPVYCDTEFILWVVSGFIIAQDIVGYIETNYSS